MITKKRLPLIGALVLAAVLVVSLAFNNSAPPTAFVNISDSYINTDRAYTVIEELSSEKYNGRLAGTEGNLKTVDYIISQFNDTRLSLPPNQRSYIQSFNHDMIVMNSKPELVLYDKDKNVIKEFSYVGDFVTMHRMADTKLQGTVNGMIVHVEDYDDLKNNAESFSDKILLVNSKVIKEFKGDNRHFDIKKFQEQVLKQNNKIKALILEYDYRRNGYFPVSPAMLNYSENTESSNSAPYIVYSGADCFKSLVESANADNKVSILYDYEYKNVNSQNVIGIIEGSDEKLKNEYVVIGAHLDHVGDNLNGTYNPGSLDNASGIAGLLEIARSLKSQNISPKKTIVFIAFNSEEVGLYGSQHYVENPIYPLATTEMINLDCIGAKGAEFLMVAVASGYSNSYRSNFLKITEGLGINTKKIISKSSDHAPFDRNNVPAIFLIHPEMYRTMHTVLDIANDTIDKKLVGDVVKMVLYYLDKTAY